MDLLYQYHLLMNQAAEYRWMAVNQALMNQAHDAASREDSWSIVAQYAQGADAQVRGARARAFPSFEISLVGHLA
jgi:hypothetical protein